MPARNRDEFSKPTKDKLAKRAGYQCSICQAPTEAASREGAGATSSVGVASHIRGGAPGSRRYDASMSPDARRHLDNGVWLCGTHSILIDRDEVTYTVARLREIKDLHEERGRNDQGRPFTQPPVVAAFTEDDRERYMKSARKLHGSIRLAGFETRVRVPIELEELCLPLTAMVDARGSGSAEFADGDEAAKTMIGKRAGLEAGCIPLTEAFREGASYHRDGLAILGDPGSGKTTHLKRLVLWLVKKGGRELGLPEDSIPVLLSLRDLQPKDTGLRAHLQRELEKPEFGAPEWADPHQAREPARASR